ncbi:ABC transporter substrate-binding protein [Rhodoferax sp. PAMC 29310]|uniref:ABC transporter substrate-binding protein n=1 Tax=Rhodoferax sp. PAMC 29310 TaxID=2822760 RepID=UPI001B335824|nr:ABC transporter substrate binding protein [Rhodoferax sp. PAMC 29310]
MGRHLLHLVLWLSWLLSGSAGAATSLLIVSSERSAAYVETAESLIVELERGGIARNEVHQITVNELTDWGDRSPRLIVTLGFEASLALAMSDIRTPILSALLPRSSFERILRSSSRKVSSQFSAIYLDQPLSRQLELIRQALPSARRLGVLWGPDSQTQAPSLRALTQSAGFQLTESVVAPEEPLFPALKRVLDEADVLLAFADPVVFNGNTVQNILLASFRARVPLVAFSPAYVRAGAVLALYVTPNQIGQQVASLARGVLLQGKSLPIAPIYAQNFTVAVNEHVAHSLGLNITPDGLTGQLRKRELAP